ncbi:MAG: cell division protein FtsQ/DivIB [Candidatus Falkowbacteria bacterium]
MTAIRRKARKFDYRKKNYKNPFFQNRKRKKIKISSKTTFRIKLIIAMIIVLIFGIMWFLCFSNFFIINNIEINNSEKISIEDIEKIAWEQTEKRRFLIITQKNLLFFNVSELIKKIEDQYCFDDLHIKKDFPNHLIINFKEKTYSAIWLENDKYYFIDNDGEILNEVNPLDITEKNYPLIEYSGVGDFSNEKIHSASSGQAENKKNINYIIKLFNEFKKVKLELKIDRFVIDEEENTVKIFIVDGPKIFFNTENDTNKQISKLIVIMNEKLKEDFYKKTYIDLRYGDRVYYR